MKKKIVSALLTATMVCGMSVVPAVPPHLQDAHYGGHEKLGHGIGYKYAHDYPNHYVHQQYLPTEIQGEHFYELSEMGYEKTLKEYQTKIKSQS